MLIIQSVVDNFLAPIRAMRMRYLPLLMIYFAYGASSFSSIAVTFWVKDSLGLTPVELAAIGVWLALPWTIKMVFGQFGDSIHIFGSARKIYVWIGAAFMAAGALLLYGAAASVPWILAWGNPTELYFSAMLLGVVGAVLQDVMADAMSTEVVQRNERATEEINRDLGMVQVLGRISLSFAAFMVAGLGGWLAQNFEYHQVFLMMLIIPVISIIGISLVKLDPVPAKPVNWWVLGGGISFAIFSAFMGLSSVPFGQEIVVMVSLIVVCSLLWSIIKDLDDTTKNLIVLTVIVIFVFRAMPGVGVGSQWWMIDELGFSESFFGVLAQIGATLSIVGMWVFARYITTKSAGYVLGWLTVLTTVLAWPIIGMYYGLHDWLGVSAHTVAIIDTALESPFGQLSMIPMLALIAIYAPRGNAATWFALMTSLMNMALSTGALTTKYLNMVFVVDRGQYDMLGYLMISSNIIGFVLPMLAIYFCMTPSGRKIIRIKTKNS